MSITSTLRRKRILVADDDRDYVESLQVRLRSKGYDVFGAFDGQSALHAAKTHKPNLIILDLQMPKGDGFHILSSLDADFKLAQIPVIILTGNDSPANRERAADCGALTVLSKPVDTETLLIAIQKALVRPLRWPGKLLGELVMQYTRADLVEGKVTSMTHESGLRNGRSLVMALANLYFVGGFACVVLLGSLTGFILSVVVGIAFLIFPDLIVRLYATLVVKRQLMEVDTLFLLYKPFRFRFFANDGITLEHDGKGRAIRWSDVDGYIDGDKTVLIVAKNGVLNIPKRAFSSHANMEEVLRIVSQFASSYTKTSLEEVRRGSYMDVHGVCGTETR